MVESTLQRQTRRKRNKYNNKNENVCTIESKLGGCGGGFYREFIHINSRVVVCGTSGFFSENLLRSKLRRHVKRQGVGVAVIGITIELAVAGRRKLKSIRSSSQGKLETIFTCNATIATLEGLNDWDPSFAVVRRHK